MHKIYMLKFKNIDGKNKETLRKESCMKCIDQKTQYTILLRYQLIYIFNAISIQISTVSFSVLEINNQIIKHILKMKRPRIIIQSENEENNLESYTI